MGPVPPQVGNTLLDTKQSQSMLSSHAFVHVKDEIRLYNKVHT